MNENISLCLFLNDREKISQNLLETEIKLIKYYSNSHFFLLQLFERFFAFLPTYVFFNEQYVLYFLPPQEDRMIKAKYAAKLTRFQNKFTKHVILITYEEPIALQSFIQNLFPHIPLPVMEFEIENNASFPISIKLYVKEAHIKFVLGRKGEYIKSINQFLHAHLDKRINLFVRSIGV